MSLSLKAASADGYYQPADFDANKHGTLNRINKTHRLGRRKRADGTVVVRFEMPYKVWCLNCNEILAKGVRFDARKKQAGSLGPGCPIFEFYMTCLFCKNPITIRTDPESTEYVCVDGCRPRIEHWSAPREEEEEEEIHDATGSAVDSQPALDNDAVPGDLEVSGCIHSGSPTETVGCGRQIDFRSVAELKELDDNPLLRKQVRTTDQNRHRDDLQRLESIKRLSDRVGQDDALSNATLRKAYRTGGGLFLAATNDTAFAGRGSKAAGCNRNFILPVVALTEDEQLAGRATLQRSKSKKPPKDRVRTLKAKLKRHMAR